MIINEPIDVLASDLVVGLSFCTNSDTTKYTIVSIVSTDDIFYFACTIVDERGKYYNAQVDGEYLYFDDRGVRLATVPYLPTYPQSSAGLIEALPVVKRYIFAIYKNKIKVC